MEKSSSRSVRQSIGIRVSIAGLAYTTITMLLMVIPTQAGAQALEEIIVTAQRREQAIQDVSLSITAFTAAEIEDSLFQNAYDIALHVPNVHVRGFSTAGKPEVSIRGINMGSLFTSWDQPSVGIYNDEVFIGNRGGQLTQMFDLERVEVLRGPQGTLYGRNTTGGAINFISKKPSIEGFDADVSMTVGNFDQFNLEAAVNVPLSETTALRVAAISRNSSGWTTNEFSDVRQSGPGGNIAEDFNNTNLWAARALLLFQPSDSTEWLLNVHGSDSNSRTPAIHTIGLGNNEPNLAGYSENPDFHTLSNNFEPREIVENWGISLRGVFDLGGTTLTSVTAYEDFIYQNKNDRDGSPNDWSISFSDENSDQFSQEFRLSKATEGGLDWVAGVFYYTDNIWGGLVQPEWTNDNDLADECRVGFDPESKLDQDTDVWAVFGDLRWSFSDSFTLLAGVRYTDEKKDFSNLTTVTKRWRGAAFIPPFTCAFNFPPVPLFTDFTETTIDVNRSDSWEETTWKIGLEWAATDDFLTFLTYSRGFKSGGFPGTAFRDASETDPYRPEIIDAYELGFKSSWADNRVIANVALFYNEIEDFHALDVGFFGFPIFDVRFTVINAEKAETSGIDFELIAQPTDNLYLNASIGYVKTEYIRFVSRSGNVQDGNEFANVPPWTASAVIQYDIPFSSGAALSPRFEYSYVDGQWWMPDNDIQRGAVPVDIINREPSYDIMNASLAWRSADDRFETVAWVRNIGDEEYHAGHGPDKAEPFSFGSAVAIASGPPRTFGVTFRYHYD